MNRPSIFNKNDFSFKPSAVSRYTPKFDVWLDWGVLRVAEMENPLFLDSNLFIAIIYPQQNENVVPIFLYTGRLTVETHNDTNPDDTITFTRNELYTFLHTHTTDTINTTFSPKFIEVKQIPLSKEKTELLDYIEREPKVSTFLWGDFPFTEGNSTTFQISYFLCVSHYERMETANVPYWAALTYTAFTKEMKTAFTHLPSHIEKKLKQNLGSERVKVSSLLDRPEGKLFHGENEPYSYGLYHLGRGGKWSRARTYSYVVKVPPFARQLLQHPHVTKINHPLKEVIPLFFLLSIYGEFLVGDDLSGNLKLLDLLALLINPQRLPVLYLFPYINTKTE